MIGPKVAVAAAVAVALAGTHLWAYRTGKTAGEARIQALWDAERVVLRKAAETARDERDAARAEYDRKAKEQQDAYSKEIERQRGAAADVRRELGRVLDAIATDRANRQPMPTTPADRPTTDGSASVTGELFGSCAVEFAGMGGEARELAAKVIALQREVVNIRQACSNESGEPSR